MDRNGRFARVLAGEAVSPPPVWLMRQAGRYLPEYRALRTQAPDFLSFCLTPDLAVEATLQPIRRFGFDASIVFADILVVPHAFGQKVWFVEGEGPRLDPIADPAGLARLAGSIDLGVLEPVCTSLRALRAALPGQTGLIGFCGAPFTVATYMIAGKGTKDQEPARLFAYRHPEAFQVLIDRITEGSIAYLCAQIAAGAEAVQVFDSWASVLPPLEFARWCVAPMKRIVAGVKAAHPEARIIGFPRGSNFPAGDFSLQTGVDAISFDTGADLPSALAALPATVAGQGNLDPLALVAGGAALDGAVDHILEVTRGRPHVFNLGHGIVPQTPIAHVEQMLERVRG